MQLAKYFPGVYLRYLKEYREVYRYLLVKYNNEIPDTDDGDIGVLSNSIRWRKYGK